MKKITRQEIFLRAAEKLRKDFDELSVVPHAALKGSQAEALVKAFLRGHLPKRFGVGSGFIIDGRDEISKQTDAIIYDALNCPVYRESEDAAIIPSDNVAAVVEVKSALDKERLRDAFINAQTVKGLAKTKPRDVIGLETSQTYYSIFAFDSPLSLETLNSHYAQCVGEFGIGRHVDSILVLDKGFLNFAVKMPGFGGWAPALIEGIPKQAEGAHIGTVSTPLGAASLDMFLRILLAHLIPFRALTGHPGFDWKRSGVDVHGVVNYITSITHETDPTAREIKLKKYADEIELEFEKNPIPGK